MTDKQVENYLSEWLPFNQRMRDKGFLWGSLLENDEWNQYMSLNVFSLQHEQHERILKATEDIASVYQYVFEYLQKNPDVIDSLGLPESTVPMVKHDITNNLQGLFSYISRMDLIINDEDIRIIEMNCDTPTGILETFVVNEELVNRSNELNDTNHVDLNFNRGGLNHVWSKIMKLYDIGYDDTIYFTSFGDHEEDRQTTNFIQESCLMLTEYIPVEDLMVSEEGVFTPEGEEIRYLYRLYPLEFLDEDVDQDGNAIGHMMIEHIKSGRLKVINPPSAFLMQSKVVMALIWELHERGDVFDSVKTDIVERHFLATYRSKSYFTFNNLPYVSKPIWGREGACVEIHRPNQELIIDDTEEYRNQVRIYQEYIEMPEATIDTWDGPYTGKLLYGSFFINGSAAGLFLRIGTEITGNLSMFAGVSVDKK